MHVVPNLFMAVIKPKNLGLQSEVANFVYHIITNNQLKTILIVLCDEAFTEITDH